MAALPLNALAAIVGADNLLADDATKAAYASDNSRLHHPPDAVAFPGDEMEIAAIVKLANRQQFPVIARGRASATTGASLAESGGLVLSTERMTHLSDVDGNLLVAQPGATNGEVQAKAAVHGLFWPPDPSSKDYCTIGGNIATAAAGPRHRKYGGARHHVLAVRAVTGGGEILAFGARAQKTAVGYDLVRLLAGSEGTLAIITEAALNLLPLPKNRAVVVARFRSQSDAVRAVVALNRLSAVATVEFMDGEAINVLRRHGKAPLLLKNGAESLLMIEVDEEPLAEAVASVSRCCRKGEVATVNDDALQNARRELSQLLRAVAPIKLSEDAAVPPPRLDEFLRGVKNIAHRLNVANVNFGHAGDGNIHINVFADDEAGKSRAREALSEISELAVSLQGALSGEHGIGITKRRDIGKQLSPPVIEIMRGVKRAFDPNNILNPTKIFPRPGE